MWLQGVALVLPQIGKEFNAPHPQMLTLALYVGLLLGAGGWGLGADVIGRRLAFNLTLFLSAVFGIAAGGANSFVAVCALIACLGVGKSIHFSPLQVIKLSD